MNTSYKRPADIRSPLHPVSMVVVPILAILGIMTLRQEHGLHAAFNWHRGTADNLLLKTSVLAVQPVCLALGLLVLNPRNSADADL